MRLCLHLAIRKVSICEKGGTVVNGSHTTIGYARGASKEWAAEAYSFFKLD
ncbi:hypothetical protein [Flavobacterium soli]|uniref:hypothetical protein n=1 Tax=Flavobacterium soli TaxID=344881 RepID=UPI00040426D2|nr:hypothetical protein [Flavobacterium soli]